MRDHLHIFLNAVMFFTRVPVPKWTRYNKDLLNRAAMYFPLVGILIGVFSAWIYWLAIRLMLPQHLAVLLAMIASALVTGGFHEDGLADVCDGFGGGWNREDILRIMKDSRLGTFGALGLSFVLIGKWSILSAFNNTYTVMYLLIASHALSRLASTSLIYFGSYAREDGTSKAKPLATKLSLGALLVASVFGFAPLALIQPPQTLLAILPVALITLWLYQFFRRWIGGYTGDCLGCVQQITEVVYYLAVFSISRWVFI